MEPIVFVNEAGESTGKTAPKLESHHDETELHLAFSCYVFDDQGKLLVTQRAKTKKVWPGFWTNSVCGHPLPAEKLEDAIRRRLKDELGMSAHMITPVLPSYRYKAPPYNGIIENEFCPVFVARATSMPKPNPDEVAATKWVLWEDFVEAIEDDSSTYEQFAVESSDDASRADIAPTWSWWCKDQLKQLRSSEAVLEFIKPISS